MQITLTPELEQLVLAKVESGKYLSAAEVIGEAVRLLDERDRLDEMKVATLRDEIQVGIDQADRGEVAPLDIFGTLAKVRDRRARLRETE